LIAAVFLLAGLGAAQQMVAAWEESLRACCAALPDAAVLLPTAQIRTAEGKIGHNYVCMKKHARVMATDYKTGHTSIEVDSPMHLFTVLMRELAFLGAVWSCSPFIDVGYPTVPFQIFPALGMQLIRKFVLGKLRRAGFIRSTQCTTQTRVCRHEGHNFNRTCSLRGKQYVCRNFTTPACKNMT
jgi:hypothetical protein